MIKMSLDIIELWSIGFNGLVDVASISVTPWVWKAEMYWNVLSTFEPECASWGKMRVLYIYVFILD